MIAHRTVAATTFAVSLLFGASALAQQANTLPLKIGVLADFASVYADIGGQGNVEAAKIAIEEFGGKMFDKPIELVTADALNKADVAATISRKWYENEGVDMIIDLPTSATALAGMEMSKQFEKIMIVTDAASSRASRRTRRAVSTGKASSPRRSNSAFCSADSQPVSVGPGSMALTVMLRGASSALSVTVKASSAALVTT